MIWCDACVNNYCDDSKCDSGRNCQARLCTPQPRLPPEAQAALDVAHEKIDTLDVMAEVGFSMAMDKGEENERLRTALEAIAGFGSVNLAGEWEHSLRDIIRSMTDCARNALQR